MPYLDLSTSTYQRLEAHSDLEMRDDRTRFDPRMQRYQVWVSNELYHRLVKRQAEMNHLSLEFTLLEMMGPFGHA